MDVAYDCAWLTHSHQVGLLMKKGLGLSNDPVNMLLCECALSREVVPNETPVRNAFGTEDIDIGHGLALVYR